MFETFNLRATLQVLLITLVAAQFQGQRSDCSTPRGTAGFCVGIRQCPQLLGILQERPLRPQAVDYLRQSQCGFSGMEPRVCCGNENGNTRPGGGQTSTGGGQTSSGQVPPIRDGSNGLSGGNGQFDLSNNPLFPRDCGKDLSQRIVGGERTELDEFPWMVLLEYRKPTGKTTACGGVLINQRYVLTAAHCVKGKDLPDTWRLESVRLGEYDTNTERDCIRDKDDNDRTDEVSEVCADDPVTVGVEEQIAHESYRPTSRDQTYDIALLRLNRNVPFTRFIKPICLPQNASLGQKLVVAGWGRTENRASSNVKLKLSLPLVERQQCDATYNNAGVRLGYGQICAGGQRGKDSCRGDSGGPLMAVERAQDGTGKWTTVGVVSFGPSPCGMLGWPGVYTRVIDFMPWIISKVRA